MSEGDKWGVGNRSGAEPFGTAMVGKTEVDLIFGEHPHSRADNNIYARFPSGHITGFDGKRVLTRVEIEESNYMKDSELSGDEIRRGGSCRIFFDGVQCYEFFLRDVQWALIKAHQLVGKLLEHSSGWAVKAQREKLVGRKIFYRERPAVIDSIIEEQGCVMVRHEHGDNFPPPVYDRERETGTTVKCEIDDPNIWWWRD